MSVQGRWGGSLERAPAYCAPPSFSTDKRALRQEPRGDSPAPAGLKQNVWRLSRIPDHAWKPPEVYPRQSAEQWTDDG